MVLSDSGKWLMVKWAESCMNWGACLPGGLSMPCSLLEVESFWWLVWVRSPGWAAGLVMALPRMVC